MLFLAKFSIQTFLSDIQLWYVVGRLDRDRMIVEFTTTYAISTYHSPVVMWIWILLRRGVLDTTLCDQVCQWLATGQWFSPGTPVSSTNKTDHHDITEKVALNTITPWKRPNSSVKLLVWLSNMVLSELLQVSNSFMEKYLFIQ